MSRTADIVLREVAADIFAGAPSLDETLERVTAAAQRALWAERASCYVTTPQQRVAMVHTTERDPARRALIEDAVGRGPDEMPIWAALTRRPQPVLAVPDAGRSRIVPPRLAARLGLGALLVIRLAHAEVEGGPAHELGLLFLSWSAPRPIRAADRRLALAFSALAATALSEARLRESHERALGVAGRAQRLGHLGIWDWDIAAARVDYSDEACRIIGLAPGEEMTLGRYLREFLDPADLPASDALRGELLAGRRDGYDLHQRLTRPDGRVINVVVRGEVSERDEAGRPRHVVGVLQDVTDQVRAEARIRASEAHLAEVQGLVSLGSWTWEIAGGGVTYSDEALRIWGLPPSADADAFRAGVHPEDRERVERVGVEAARECLAYDVTHRIVRPDGAVRVVHSRGEAVDRDGAGRPARYVGTIQDVTERIEREQELRRSEDRNRRLAAEQAALRRVAVAVAQGDPPEAVFALVARQVADFLGVETGFVCRFEGDSSVVIGTWGHQQASPGSSYPLRGDGALPLVWRTGRAASARYASMAPDDPSAARAVVQGYRTGVAAPVTIGGAPWGAILAVTTTDRRFGAEDERGLERFAELVALAIANAEARAQLVAWAAGDPLTGLANHRTVHEAIRTELARARRHGRPLSLALFDLDHFKEVNDTHGHQVGDQVLVQVADLMREVARDGDVVGRVGGEEFAWLMPETEALGAYEAAERLRVLVGKGPLTAAQIRLTVSAGVCDLGHASSPSELVALADGALYRAKAHGRNVSFLYTPEVVEALSAEERADGLERTRTRMGLRALARAVDARDSGDAGDGSTLRHSERVAELAGQIAAERGWSVHREAELREAALVHDVGKIAIPDAILFKPARLTPAEYEQVKGHVALGAEIAAEILSPEQVAWVRGHHEWWDGGGYPDGLSGEEIPEGARILALADALDAMTSARPYQAVMSWAEALAECARGASTQFDPASSRSAELISIPRPPPFLPLGPAAPAGPSDGPAQPGRTPADAMSVAVSQ